jgi:hypothetical protein
MFLIFSVLRKQFRQRVSGDSYLTGDLSHSSVSDDAYSWVYNIIYFNSEISELNNSKPSEARDSILSKFPVLTVGSYNSAFWGSVTKNQTTTTSDA